MSELKKKPSLLYILQILQKYSHEGNPLSQNQIAEYLLDEYDIELERKAISRCIGVLEMAGYDIVPGPSGKGVFLGSSSELEDTQLQIIIDSVASNRTISAADSKKLIDQLMAMGTAGLKAQNQHINSLNAWGKPEKSSAHYNIGTIQQAIQERHQISFLYDEYTYGLHHPLYGLHRETEKDERVLATPIQIVAKDSYEYLVAIIQWEPEAQMEYRMEAFRLDLVRSVDVENIPAVRPEKVPGYEKGFDLKKFITAYPTMTTSRNPPQTVKFAFQAWDKDVVTRSLGSDIWIQPAGDKPRAKSNKAKELEWMIATTSMGIQEAVNLAIRYPRELVLLYPDTARDAVKRAFSKAVRDYQWAEEHFLNK